MSPRIAPCTKRLRTFRRVPTPSRTPAKAGVQLGDVAVIRNSLPTWTPAFAGVRTGIVGEGFARTGARPDHRSALTA